jgi:hypothetical protein
MKFQDKELEFNYYNLKKVAESVGCELHEVPGKYAKADISKLAELGLKCILFCTDSTDEVAIQKQIKEAEILYQAAKEYMEEYTKFFGLKGEGEQVAH